MNDNTPILYIKAFNVLAWMPLAMLLLCGGSVSAASITLTAADPGGSSSFNSAGNWSDGLAPHSGNAYFTSTFQLRSPTANSTYTFGGDTLSVDSGNFRIKSLSTMNANYIFNGGIIYGNSQNGAGTITLGGTVVVNSASTFAVDGNGSILKITAPISGAAGLTTPETTGSTATGTVRLSAANSYSGTFTLNGTSTGVSAANRWLQLDNIDALSNATLVLSTTVANPVSFTTTTNVYNLGALSGTASQQLQRTDGSTMTLNVGGNNGSSTYSGVLSGLGALTKSGSGALTLGGANTYSGATTISAGTLALASGGALGGANQNITLSSGATLDVSAVGGIVLGSNQSLIGGGTVNGSVTTAASANSDIFPGTDGGAGTLTFGNDLTMSSGSTLNLDVGTTAASGNDKVVVTGALTLNSTALNIRALNGAANLDTTADYVLVTAGSINGSPYNAINWVGTRPANAGNFTVVKSGNNIDLNYTPGTPPTITSVTASPNTLFHAQKTLITATVTAGSNPVNAVTVSGPDFAGTVTLISNGAGNYTNTVPIALNAPQGSQTNNVVAADTIGILGFGTVTVTALSTNEVWNGAGSDNNWSTGGNWVSGIPPYAGDAAAFAGSTRTSPNMDSGISLGSLTFASGAGAFTLGSAGNYTLGLTGGGVTNNSANMQTINVPVSLSTNQTINAGTGGVTLGGNIGGVGGLGTTGNALLSGTNTYSGNTVIGTGTLSLGSPAAISSGTNAGLAAGLVILNPTSGTATLNLNGQSQTINALTNSGAGLAVVDNTSGAGIYTLTVGTNGVNTSTTFSGNIQNSSGTVGLTMAGGGTLALSGTNTYTGDTTVNAGTLTLSGNKSGGGNLWITNDSATINISSNATVVVGAPNQISVGSTTVNSGSTETLNVNGVVTNNGALNVVRRGFLNLNSGGNWTQSGAMVVTAVGGYGSSMTVNAGGRFTYSGGSEIQVNSAPNNVGSETLNINGVFATGQGFINTATASTGSGNVVLQSGGRLVATADIANLVDPATSTLNFQMGSGNGIIDTGGHNVTMAGVISGGGTLVKDGAGALILQAFDSLTGGTIVSNGVLEVDGYHTGPVTVSGGALTGVGSIYTATTGAVTVNSSGTLMPGTSGLGDGLSMSSINLTLRGNAAFRISKNGGSPANNGVYYLASVTYGGTLTVTNITSDSTPLANGDSFYLFQNAATYGGAFTNYNLPPLPAGLAWEVSGLNVNGNISVVNQTPTPVFYPSAGGYINPLAVQIFCTDTNATIYYSTNGWTTTNVYGGPISVPANANGFSILAYANDLNLSGPSPVASAAYSTVSIPVWLNSSGGSWATTVNWSNNAVANGVGVVADFSQLTLPASETVTLDGTWTVGGLMFGDVGNTYAWTLNAGGGGPLTLNAGTNTPAISVLNQTTTIGAVLAGTNGFTKTGAGTLTFSAANTYTGNTVVNGGTLMFSGSGTTPNGNTFIITNGGTLTFGRSDTWGNDQTTTSAAITVNSGGTLLSADGFFETLWNLSLNGGTVSLGGGHSASFPAFQFAGTLTATGDSAVNIVSGNFNIISIGGVGNGVLTASTPNATDTLTVNAPLQNNQRVSPSGLTKTGLGTLTLNAVNSYTGTTTVSNGVLQVNGIIGSGAMAVNGGTLGGTGTIQGATTIASGGKLAPGPVSGIGTLSINNSLNLSGNASFALNRTNAQTASMVAGITAVTYGGTLTVTNEGDALQSGDTFTLFSASSYSGSFAATNLPALSAGLGWDTSGLATNGSIKVVTTTLPPPTLSGGMALGGGQFKLTFSGPSNQTYSVLSSTNLTLPLASWTMLTSGTFAASPVIYTNTTATNSTQFYIIKSP